MSNSYFSTTQIEVFPSAYRIARPNGKYTSEHNFINIIRALADRDSFVINAPNTSTTEPLRCVIHGYYFVIEDIDQLFVNNPNATGLWLRIGLENTSANSLVSLADGSVNLDVNSLFKGLEYITAGTWATERSDLNYYYLQAMGEVDGTIKYVNQIRLSTKSVYYDIDDYSSYTGHNDLQTVLNKALNMSGSDRISITDNPSDLKDSDILVPGKVISLSDDTTSLLDSLESSSLGAGGIAPLYYDSSNKVIRNSNKTVGSTYSGGTTKEIRLIDGSLVDGLAIHTSTSAPGNTKTVNGVTFKAGDIWLKVKE